MCLVSIGGGRQLYCVGAHPHLLSRVPSMGLTQSTDAHLSALSDSLSTERFKMAAASSIQPPNVHSIKRENSPHPESDSPASRQEEDAASEGITILRDLPELDPEEIEKRLEKTRRELSNRRKILIKNLPQDTTNQVEHLHTSA